MKEYEATLNTTHVAVNSQDYSDTAPQFSRLRDPLVEVVLPVLNEERTLEPHVRTLDAYLSTHLPYRYHITIADNGSTDATQLIARALAREYETIGTIRLTERGRGRALKKVWNESSADILAYMDVDLSTDLADFLPLIRPLVSGHAGIAIGSRLAHGAKTTRSLKREVISRCYNKLIKWSAGTKFSDAQCGFKAIRRDVARKYLPRVKDTDWFFDTELLIKAERSGVQIHEQPVTWVEDADSRVKIVKTAVDDLKGLHRVNKELDKRSPFEKFALPLLLIATGALYLFGALQNGMANSYYAAAVQAASQNWTAWLFGSLDAANYISIDKPPLATMIMGLSARLFGFSSFSMLLPSVLAGVGSVWLLYSIVKRQFGFKSACIAAVTLALTPVAALMFGFNNPDAILTFLLTASAYAFLRSLEGKKPYLWLGLAALLSGLAFNTKMLQGLMVLPAIVIVYCIFAKPPLLTRLLHLAYAGVITTIATLWWSVLVWLTPAASRPWVGSTSDNNIWSLILGYNGFGRLFGSAMGGGSGGRGGFGADGGTQMGQMAQTMGSASGVTGGQMTIGGGGMGGPGGSGFGGSTGLLRMWNTDFGPNIGWLLLAALLGGGVMLWILRKTPRDNRGRAAVVFWLLWLLIHTAIFSMTSGTIHPYYVVVMAPAVAALIGISVPFLWAAYKRRKNYAVALPIIVLATTIIALVLLSYTTAFSWLGWLIAITGGLGALLLTINLYLSAKSLLVAGVVGSLIACTAGPLVYTATTVTTAHTGSVPTAGPSGTALSGSNNENATAETALVNYLLENQNGATWIVAVASANESAALQLSTGQPVMAVGGFNGSDSALTLDEFKELVRAGKVQHYAVSTSGGRGGGMGGNSDIAEWVETYGTKVGYGGSSVTLYKLSAS